MAITKQTVDHAVARPVLLTTFTMDLDATYPAGGYALDSQAHVRGGKILAVRANPKDGYTFEWDPANDKMIVRILPAIATADAASPMDAAYVQAEQTAQSDLLNEIKVALNLAAMEEVTAAVNLSAVTGVEVEIWHTPEGL